MCAHVCMCVCVYACTSIPRPSSAASRWRKRASASAAAPSRGGGGTGPSGVEPCDTPCDTPCEGLAASDGVAWLELEFGLELGFWFGCGVRGVRGLGFRAFGVGVRVMDGRGWISGRCASE